MTIRGVVHVRVDGGWLLRWIGLALPGTLSNEDIHELIASQLLADLFLKLACVHSWTDMPLVLYLIIIIFIIVL